MVLRQPSVLNFYDQRPPSFQTRFEYFEIVSVRKIAHSFLNYRGRLDQLPFLKPQPAADTCYSGRQDPPFFIDRIYDTKARTVAAKSTGFHRDAERLHHQYFTEIFDEI